ncbi:hypothetical protein [Symmachiella dynata]|uniref:hypothetical protein n=1 Tax=Symmachiella dynata TaxID=2527995 RepID=UPI0030EB93FE
MFSRQSAALVFGCITLATVLYIPSVAEAKISAVPGRRYTIDKRHGPWMIMVTNLRGETEEARKNAAEGADALVLELRKKGLPAYVYSQEGKLQSFEAVDQLGRRQTGAYAAQRNQIAVIAGNYSSIDPTTKEGKTAQKTLEWIKNFIPTSLGKGRYIKTPGKPNPFSRAMLVPNPLLTPDELQQRKDHKHLSYLNNGLDYSLSENPGKLTLVVATFHGDSISMKDSGDSATASRIENFEKGLKKSQSLDKAYKQSYQLVQLMRNQNFEAYIWHDRYQSYVTVGSFNNKHDPRIQTLYERFRAKQKEYGGQTHLVAESIQAKRNLKDGKEIPMLNFTMDPKPRLMTVPEL